jgi:uncharacterized membrane protein (UPF0136 family)
VRAVVALSLAGALPAAVGGLVFWAAHGGTTLTRSVAYGFWFAAAVVLALMVLAGRRFVWRRTRLPVPEGWVFVGAAAVLTVAGAGIDAAAGI